MKTKELKQEEARLRAIDYSYENSKGKRTGSLTKQEWEEKNRQVISGGK